MNSNLGKGRNFERKSALLFTALVLAGGATTAQAQSNSINNVWTASQGTATSSTPNPTPLHPQATNQAVQNPFRPSPAAQVSSTSFDRADMNRDGQLSTEEAAQLPTTEKWFKQLDSDQNGRLSREEFEKAPHS